MMVVKVVVVAKAVAKVVVVKVVACLNEGRVCVGYDERHKKIA